MDFGIALAVSKAGGARITQTGLSLATLDVVKRDPLFADRYVKEGEGQGWDIFPNGKEFVFVKGVSAPPAKLIVLVNWQQLMKAAEKK